MKNKTEIWKPHPEYAGIEVSTLGRIRTLDKMVWNGMGTWLMKGRILKQPKSSNGYPMVGVTIDGKRITKYVHRIVAQTFIKNPDNLPDVNHKNCIRDDNRVENLEWCTASYNRQYQEKFGEALGIPVIAISLVTMEFSQFKSQSEASRVLGVSVGSVNNVIKGKCKHTCGYLFVSVDESAANAIKCKLKDIKGDI